MLVVSQEPSALSPLWLIGEANSWQLETAASGWEALERAQSGSVLDLVVLDLARGDADGLHTLRWLRRVRPDLAVLLISYSADDRQKGEAIRLGAQDYLVRPIEERQLERALRDLLALGAEGGEGGLESADIEALSDGNCFVAAGPDARKIREQAKQLAQVDAPVLLVGEGGSGKEIVARLIHKLSLRSGSPFLKLNCAALPEDLLDNELFTQERRGSISTGLAGKLEMCDRGILFLDAITEMPGKLQSKLLQLLKQKLIVGNGGHKAEMDVRIFAASNANLEQALLEHRLKEDFYYWLSAFSVYVPPLRQRKEEIPPLLAHFMNQIARHYGLQSRIFSRSLLETCQHHCWPCNLRELESFVKRYLVIGDEELALAELKREMDSPTDALQQPWPDSVVEEELEGAEAEEPASGLKSLVQSVKGEAEKNAIALALEQTHWNRKAAARLLQVSYRTLLYKIQQYHMSPPSYFSPYGPNLSTKSNGHGR
jgi:DNA-binding NtrC family response regulator